MELTKEIANSLGQRFSSLRLFEAELEKSSNTLTVVFLYPESCQTYSDYEKSKILEYLKDKLQVSSKIELKFKKSFLDPELVSREILSYLKEYYQSVSANMSIDQISAKKITDDFVEVEIRLEKDLFNFFSKNEIQESIRDWLLKHFISDFDIKIKRDDSICLDEKLITERAKALEESENILSKPKSRRYMVKDVCLLIGKDIAPKPEFIRDIKSQKNGVILSGVISYFQKRFYVKKKDKDLGDNAPQNPWYSFVLTDDEGGKISVTYFCPKSNEKKFDKLVDSTRVLCLGDVKPYGDKMSYYLNSLALCEKGGELEKKLEIQDDFSRYKFILPEAFQNHSQENLFFEKPKYQKDILEKTFVVYDFETTGLDTETCEIVEIGACKIKNGEIVQTFSTLVKNLLPIPFEASKINGITDEMTKDAPTIEKALRDFKVFCNGSVLVGHNSIGYDDKILQRLSRKFGLDFSNEQRDTLILSRQKLRLGRYNLSSVSKALGISLIDAHRALNDVLATANVFLKLNEIVL